MYPFVLNNVEIKPFFKNLTGNPYYFDFTTENPKQYSTLNFELFQLEIYQELANAKAEWGIGKYLENRSKILKDYPQMISEQRVYHLGLDVTALEGEELYAPIAGVVHDAGHEPGVGNYGGYVILKHTINNYTFYTFWGHLNSNHIVTKNQSVQAGDLIGKIGSAEDAGGWFTHVHLQVLTEKAAANNRFFNGYGSLKDLEQINELFPNPYFLFKF